jgi:hypothetical protein
MQQLLRVTGVEPEHAEVIDEAEGLRELERLYAVRDSLQAQSLEVGRSLVQERYAVRPTIDA